MQAKLKLIFTYASHTIHICNLTDLRRSISVLWRSLPTTSIGIVTPSSALGAILPEATLCSVTSTMVHAISALVALRSARLVCK